MACFEMFFKRLGILMVNRHCFWFYAFARYYAAWRKEHKTAAGAVRDGAEKN
jgi:hypothetical protein